MTTTQAEGRPATRPTERTPSGTEIRPAGCSVLEPDIRRVNLGCGTDVRPGWINVDREDADGVVGLDLERALPIYSNSCDHVEICHALEHVVYWRQLLGEINRILRPDGTVFIRVPDFDYALRAYLGDVSRSELVPYTDARGFESLIDWHHLIFGAPAGRRHESNPHVTGFSWDTERDNDLAVAMHAHGFRFLERVEVGVFPFEIGAKGVKRL